MLPLPSDTDHLPPAAVTEVASILAKGYVRYRASLRNPLYDLSQEIQAQTQPESQPPAPPAAAHSGLAFPVLPSVHVTVVNAKRKKTKGEQR
jgi:hypothetical protein